MAGNSQRYLREGYTLPKYMLYVGNRSLFNLSVNSFNRYFNSADFLFVARNTFDTKRFIEEECRLMGLKKYKVLMLESQTRGQAETVYLGIRGSNLDEKEDILIFNIDTIRKNYTFPKQLTQYDGFIEVFKGSGENWSYVEPMDHLTHVVKRTAEKEEISNLCSTGLYYFKNQIDFCEAFIKSKNYTKGESYVAPLYNYLIRRDRQIHFHLINEEEVIFSGVPDEYLKLVKSFKEE